MLMFSLRKYVRLHFDRVSDAIGKKEEGGRKRVSERVSKGESIRVSFSLRL